MGQSGIPFGPSASPGAGEFAEILDSIRGYNVLPYSWDDVLRVRSPPSFLPSLTGVLAWIAEKLDSWPRRRMGADLFGAVARKYDDKVLDLLRKALSAGTESAYCGSATSRGSPDPYLEPCELRYTRPTSLATMCAER